MVRGCTDHALSLKLRRGRPIILSLLTDHVLLGSYGLGRGRGVGRTLGIGLPLGVGVGRGVEVAVAVGVGVGVAHGVSMYVRDWFCGGESGQQMQKSSV